MTPQPSMKIVKTFQRRGSLQVFTNRYHFDNGPPTSDADWLSFFDAVVAQEKTLYTSGVQIIEAVGYDAGSDLPVASKSYTTNGTRTNLSNEVSCPSEAAALARYTTTQRTSKNHPIYLFNYYHGAVYDGDVSSDRIGTGQQAAINTYAGQWVSGFDVDGTVHHRCGPNGAVAQTGACEQWLSHRDFRK